MHQLDEQENLGIPTAEIVAYGNAIAASAVLHAVLRTLLNRLQKKRFSPLAIRMKSSRAQERSSLQKTGKATRSK